MQTFTTSTSEETKKLAKDIAGNFRGGEIVCLSGDLGAGKTTFAQGLLEALGAEGPYTSPTFTIVKEYEVKSEKLKETPFSLGTRGLRLLYHIDAYRIDSAGLSDLGFINFAGMPDTVTIVEWPGNVSGIIPSDALRVTFTWLNETHREISLENFEIKK